jgi:MFS family permease
MSPALNATAGWFDKKRGMAYGIIATGSSVGGVVFPIMISRLIRTVGFGWAMRVSAFLILVLLIIANLTIKARHPPTPQKLSPGQLAQPFREVQFLAVTLGLFLFTFGMFAPITYLPVQALSAGMDPELVQYLIAMLNAAR